MAVLLAPCITTGATLTAPQIAARLTTAIAAESQHILDEGIAQSASDIDLVQIHGYGYPRWRGGPMFEAARG